MHIIVWKTNTRSATYAVPTFQSSPSSIYYFIYDRSTHFDYSIQIIIINNIERYTQFIRIITINVAHRTSIDIILFLTFLYNINISLIVIIIRLWYGIFSKYKNMETYILYSIWNILVHPLQPSSVGLTRTLVYQRHRAFHVRYGAKRRRVPESNCHLPYVIFAINRY